MTEKFDNFNNDFEKENNEINKKEYEEAFFESLIDSMMMIYEHFKKDNPKFAKYLENDYNEFIKEIIEYFKQNKTVGGFLKYIISKNPNNLWVDVVEIVGQIGIVEAIKNPDEQKEYQKLDNEIRNLITKRKEKKDIQ